MTMIQTSIFHGVRTEDWRLSTSDQARNLLLFAMGVQVAFLVPSAIAYFIDERLLNEVSVWSKPIKFQISILLTLGTSMLLLRLLDEATRASRTIRGASLVMARPHAGARPISMMPQCLKRCSIRSWASAPFPSSRAPSRSAG
jgi:hypothetical protein